MERKRPSGYRPELLDLMIGSLAGNPLLNENNLRIYRHVRLCDLTTDSPLSTAPRDELRRSHCFPFLICHGPDVVLTGSPVLIGDMESRTCEGLAFRKLLTMPPDRQTWIHAVLDRLRLWTQVRPHAFWQYEPRTIEPGDLPMLADMGLVSRLSGRQDSPYRCSPYGIQRGLAEYSQPVKGGKGTFPVPCTTAAAWLELWEPREDDAPPGGSIPLDQLLRGMKECRIADPYYYTSSLERLMDMPMSMLLSGIPKGLRILEEELGDTSLTYLETARRVEQMFQNADQKKSAQRIIDFCLTWPFSTCYYYRQPAAKSQGGRWGWYVKD